MFDDTNLNDQDMQPITLDQYFLKDSTPTATTPSVSLPTNSIKNLENQKATYEQPECSERSADFSNTQSKTVGRKPHSEHYGMTPKASLVHAVQVRGTVESGIISKLKQLGQISSGQLYEVVGLGAYLGGRAVNSTRAAWEEEVVINRPDYLVDWAKSAVPFYSNMVYIQPEKHPQLSHIRSRVSGITHAELRRGRMDFEDAYAIEFESTIGARAAFQKLMEMVTINLHFDPSASLVPQLANHYRMDAASKAYAVAANRGDMDLILSTFN